MGVRGVEGTGYEGEGETLEAEFASRLLEVTTEAEIDRFLGDLAKSVVKGASSFIKSPVGKALGGVLKNVAKTALPAVGGALGSLVLPGAGTAIGAKLGSLAGGLLEAGEAETMGEAEAEYEAAQRYVRFARSAYGLAARAPRDIPPRSVARAASYRRHAAARAGAVARRPADVAVAAAQAPVVRLAAPALGLLPAALVRRRLQRRVRGRPGRRRAVVRLRHRGRTGRRSRGPRPGAGRSGRSGRAGRGRAVPEASARWRGAGSGAATASSCSGSERPTRCVQEGQPDGLLEYEARALLARLDQVKPFALHETMVLAAALPYRAQRCIEQFCTAAVAASAHASTNISVAHRPAAAVRSRGQQRRSS